MSSTEKLCLICCNNKADENNHTPNELKRLFTTCYGHLPSVIVAETSLKDIQFANESEVSVCQHCCHLAVEILRVADNLSEGRKELANLILSFSVAVLNRRNVFQSADSTSLPTNWCSKNVLQEIQNARQINDCQAEDYPATVNPAFIEEGFPANISDVVYEEIIVETVEENQPTAADMDGFSDMSESFFIEEFPDNSMQLADLLEERLSETEFSYVSDNEMINAESCSDNPRTNVDKTSSRRFNTMSHAELLKTIRLPTIFLKRIPVPSSARIGNEAAPVSRRRFAVKKFDNSVAPKSVRVGKTRATKSVKKNHKVPPVKGKKNSGKTLLGIKDRRLALVKKQSRKGKKRATCVVNRTKRELLPLSEELHFILRGSYFKITKLNGNSVEAICQNCSGPSKVKVKGFYNNASKFLRHLKNVHPKMLKKYWKEEFIWKKMRMIVQDESLSRI